MKYYISIEKNIEGFDFYKALWSLRGIVGVRADTMDDGIEKAIEIENSKTDELYFIDIVADDIDYMPHLRTLSAKTTSRTESMSIRANNCEYYSRFRNYPSSASSPFNSPREYFPRNFMPFFMFFTSF
jgi:hypothetical protein